MALVYTTIQHPFRKKHGLTVIEYVLIDMVYLLSVKPDSDVPGWCYMSKQTMADEIGISRRTVINLINTNEENGFLERHQITKHLRTTKKWQKVYFTDGAKNAHPVQNDSGNGANSAPDGSANSAHNINNIYNNINKGLLSEVNTSDIPSEFKFYFEVSLKFQELIKQNLAARNSPTKKVDDAKVKVWVEPVRLMIERDKVTREMLLQAYAYLNGPDSTFWKPNILSTANLRKNITQLLAQANNNSTNGDTVAEPGSVAEKLKAHD